MMACKASVSFGLARWALQLEEFDFTVFYKRGGNHKDADCLSSRRPLPSFASTGNNHDECLSPTTSGFQNLDTVHLRQREAPVLQSLFQDVVTGSSYSVNSTVRDHTLYKRNFNDTGVRWLLDVTCSWQLEALRAVHDCPMSGHKAFMRTFSLASQRLG